MFFDERPIDCQTSTTTVDEGIGRDALAGIGFKNYSYCGLAVFFGYEGIGDKWFAIEGFVRYFLNLCLEADCFTGLGFLIVFEQIYDFIDARHRVSVYASF